MELSRGVRRLLRIAPGQARVERDLDDELAFHFHETVEALIASGLTESEALAAARARFGDEAAYRRALERIDRRRIRMERRVEVLDTAVRAIVQALRGVRRSPGFTASVVVVLALGLGANAVMFGVVDRLLLSPPRHVRDADAVRLLYVQRQATSGDIDVERYLTYPDYQDFQGVGAFSAVAAYARTELTAGRGEGAGRADVVRASPTLFPLLGVQPALGRFFGGDDDAPGAAPTAVLSHEHWERAYGRDPGVLGRTLDVGPGRYTIVGVAPPGFTGADLRPVDVWLPLLASASGDDTGCLGSRGCYWLHAVARLAEGSSVEAAEAEATAAHRGGRAQLIAESRYDAGAEVLVAPVIAARGPIPTREAEVARWLAGVSLVVLLIACFNVANLLLARAITTRREVALRLALGVGRPRLVAEMLLQTLVLAGMGAAAALLLARVLGGTLHRVLLPNVSFGGAALSGRILTFTVLATVAAALLAGVVPALQTSRAHLADALKAGGRGAGAARSRTRATLLVGQAGLSVVLLVGAALFVKSLRTAEGLDLGYDARHVAVVFLEWTEALPAAERRDIYERVREGALRLPGVHDVGLSYTVPFWSSISLGRPRVPGLDSVPRHSSGGPYVNKVGAGYFEAMGLSILRGRAFVSADDGDEAPPVAVVSENMARTYWPAGDALGSCLLVGSDEGAPCTEVVGVVENHRREALVEDDPHFLYFLNQSHPAFQGPPQALMVGTSGRAESVVGPLREIAAASSSEIRFVQASSLADFVAPQLRSWRLGAAVFTAFGLLALIVAAWGLYGVLAFDVALRRHELGVRSALGAGVVRLVTLVLRRALALVAIGVALGLLAAWAAGRFLEPLLFRVSATDPAVFGLVGVALLGVGALAGALPALRATRVDPREALQTE